MPDITPADQALLTRLRDLIVNGTETEALTALANHREGEG